MNWGMKNRMSRIIQPDTGRCLMLAVDHGYFQGPTTGLRDLTAAVMPLLPYADALMITRGALHAFIAPEITTPIILRMSGGPTVLRELSNEVITTTVEDAIRMNASAITCSVYVGAEFETECVNNLAQLVNEGEMYGIPVLAVTAVGKDMNRDARFLGLASRVCVEIGAHIVKTYYTEDFDTVVEACGNIPVVMAGGKKIPERDAMQMARNAVDNGAVGVDMGRNIFQSEHPVAMIKAVRALIHEDLSVDEAFAIYEKEAAVGVS